MIQLFPTGFPPQTSPIVDDSGKLNNNTGNPFLSALWQRTGAGTGIVNQTVPDIATIDPINPVALMADWNLITAAAGGAGVTLPSLVGGQLVVVANQTLSGVPVFPPTGYTIDGVTSQYTLPSMKMQIFFFFSDSVILSCQLG